MRKLFFLIYLLGIGIFCFAQKGDRQWQFAEDFFNRKEYASAVEYYKLASTKSAYKTKALHRLVQCFRILNNEAEALYYAKLLKSKNASDSSSVTLGQVLKENGLYIEARNEFFRLVQKNPSNAYYQNLLTSCDSSILWKKAKPSGSIINLSSINSEYSEISPSLQNEKKLVFSSNREGMIIKKKSGYSGEAFYDLYESDKAHDNRWQKPSLMSSEINSVHHEFAPSFSHTGDTIYFTKSIDRTKTTKDSVNRLKLYSASRESQKDWGSSHIFILNDSLFSFAHPFMDPSGNMFFFASDLKGGYGNSDIYVCFRKDSLWSSPINLGPVINSAANETYPFYKNGILYFSSNTETGMGGYDIYKAIQENGDWIRIQNLRSPINSPSDDFAFILTENAKQAYFSSNRKNGKGKEDIYQVTFSE